MKARKPIRPGQLPAYLDAVARLAEHVKPGTVNHVEVRHDEWCDWLNGRGGCNCHPDVRLVKPS